MQDDSHMKYITFIILLIANIILIAERIAEFPWISEIPILTMAQDYFYVGNIRDGKITIISRKNNQKLSTFGGNGQGPGEFYTGFGKITVVSKDMYVYSPGKIGRYTLQGQMLEENRLPMDSGHYIPAGRYLVCHRSEQTNTYDKTIIALTDWHGKVVRELVNHVGYFTGKRGLLTVMRPCFDHMVAGGKIVVLDAFSNQLKIYFFDIDGKPLCTVQPQYEKKRVDDGYKKMVQVELEDVYKNRFRRPLKWKLFFPDYFPICESFSFDGTYIYLYTFYGDAKTRELWVMDQEGNVIRKKQVPYGVAYSIFNGTFYCFLENDQTENMELHAFPLLK